MCASLFFSLSLSVSLFLCVWYRFEKWGEKKGEEKKRNNQALSSEQLVMEPISSIQYVHTSGNISEIERKSRTMCKQKATLKNESKNNGKIGDGTVVYGTENYILHKHFMCTNLK